MTIIPVKEGCARKSLDDKMNFGKFAHLTVEEVARSNPNYLVWAVKNIPWFEMDSLGRRFTQRALEYFDREAMSRQNCWAWGVLKKRLPPMRFQANRRDIETALRSEH